MIAYTEADAVEFIDRVAALVDGAVAWASPDQVSVVRINNWFGPRWLAFSGQLLGALGVHSTKNLTIPPFNPSRVMSEQHWARDEAGRAYQRVASGTSLHTEQPSADNFKRQ